MNQVTSDLLGTNTKQNVKGTASVEKEQLGEKKQAGGPGLKVRTRIKV